MSFFSYVFSLFFVILAAAFSFRCSGYLPGEIPAFYFSAVAQLERHQSGFCSISNRFWWLQTRGQPRSAHRDRVEIYRGHYHKLERKSERALLVSVQQSHEISWKLKTLAPLGHFSNNWPLPTCNWNDSVDLYGFMISMLPDMHICIYIYIYISFSFFQGLISASLWTRGTLNDFSVKLKSNLHQWVLHTTMTMTVWLSDIVFFLKHFTLTLMEIRRSRKGA